MLIAGTKQVVCSMTMLCKRVTIYCPRVIPKKWG